MDPHPRSSLATAEDGNHIAIRAVCGHASRQSKTAKLVLSEDSGVEWIQNLRCYRYTTRQRARKLKPICPAAKSRAVALPRRRDARGAIGLSRLIGSELRWLARIDSCY